MEEWESARLTGLGCLGQSSGAWDPWHPWHPETQMLCPRCPDAQTSGGPGPQFLSQMGIDHQGDRRQRRLDDEEATLILQGMGYTPQGPTNRACKDSVTEVPLGILRGCGLGSSAPEQSGVQGLRHSKYWGPGSRHSNYWGTGPRHLD